MHTTVFRLAAAVALHLQKGASIVLVQQPLKNNHDKTTTTNKERGLEELSKVERDYRFFYFTTRAVYVKKDVERESYIARVSACASRTETQPMNYVRRRLPETMIFTIRLYNRIMYLMGQHRCGAGVDFEVGVIALLAIIPPKGVEIKLQTV